MNLSQTIIDLLNIEAARYNKPDFIEDDPVQFPRLFKDKRDIEIASLLCSAIAWGNRKTILKSCNKMLALMEWQPFNYMMDKGHEELPSHVNIHRTFFNRDLSYFLRGLYNIYVKHGSLEDFAIFIGAPADAAPAWKIAEGINAELCNANEGASNSRCLPTGLDKSALKRLNMALRWLVRDDGIVDLGVWKAIKPSQLFIPMDVHVGNVSREIGLLNRKQTDRRAVEELTDTLRAINPDDPVLYDFALFSIGINSRKIENL